MNIPDRFRPLFGVRQFVVDQRGGIWSPNRNGYRWGTDFKVSECSPGRSFKRLDDPHISPDPNCCCGINVGYDLETLGREGTIRLNARLRDRKNKGESPHRSYDVAELPSTRGYLVYGVVAVTGNVEKYENLMTAQNVKILGLIDAPKKYHYSDAMLQKSWISKVAVAYGFAFLDFASYPSVDVKLMRAISGIFNCDYWCPTDAPLNEPAEKGGETDG